MWKVFIASCGLLVTSVCALAEEESVAKSLGKGDEASSPNGKASCVVDYSGKDWNEVKAKFSDGKTQTVWKSVRSVGVSWSPDGQYLAVEDYLDRLASAVLVFKINYSSQDAELVYQTPYSNSVFEHYYVAGWMNGGASLRIKRSDHDTRAVKSEETVLLSNRKKITQTIYPDSHFRDRTP